MSSVLGALAIAGCQSHPTHVYPMLPPAASGERALNCDQLDDAILRSDAVRWSMRTEGMKVRTSATNTGEVLASIPMIAVSRVLVTFTDLDNQARVSAADTRIIGLLEIKSSKGCPARATTTSNVTDLDVLHQLQILDADWKAQKISEGIAIDHRAHLLDGLCDPQAIRAAKTDAKPPQP
jgi:hypothetical protein